MKFISLPVNLVKIREVYNKMLVLGWMKIKCRELFKTESPVKSGPQARIPSHVEE